MTSLPDSDLRAKLEEIARRLDGIPYGCTEQMFGPEDAETMREVIALLELRPKSAPVTEERLRGVLTKAADLLMDCSWFIRNGTTRPSIADLENSAGALRDIENSMRRVAQPRKDGEADGNSL